MTARTSDTTSRDTLRAYITAFLGGLKDTHADPEDVRAVLAEFLGGDPADREIKLGVIRHWPDGMGARVEHVWRDLVGFTVDYKLYDLSRVLAEFGFAMKVFEARQEKSNG